MKAQIRTVPADQVLMITKASAVVDIMLEAVREVESDQSPAQERETPDV